MKKKPTINELEAILAEAGEETVEILPNGEVRILKQTQIDTYTEFRKKLRDVINECSMESTCDVPDFILANYLVECFHAFVTAKRRSESWHGKKETPPTTAV